MDFTLDAQHIICFIAGVPIGKEIWIQLEQQEVRVEIRPRFFVEGGASVLRPKALFLGLMAVFVAGFALGGQAIPNWSAPATWTPPRSGGAHALDITNPVPFVGLTPCRIADTRGNGFGGAFGPPPLVANADRTFPVVGVCGIPASAVAVSFNFAALNVGAAGDLRVYPAGSPLPLVSTLNYNASTPNIANAAVVPLGPGGITVRADAVSVDLIIDINGYYYDGTSISLPVGRQFQITGVCNGCSTVYGENGSTVAGSRAVRGAETGTTGSTFGVLGDNASTSSGSAGVVGTDGTGNPTGTSNLSAGVLGQSTTHIGVQGDSQVAGVRGESYTTAGAFLHLGILGGSTYGVFSNGNIEIFGGVKNFVEPHPTEAGMEIRYVSLEGNEVGTYFRGTATTVDGEAVIDVPEDFRLVTEAEGLSVQITPVGRSANMFVLSEDLNQIVVRANRDVKFHYTVNGIRRNYKDYKVISEGTVFMPYSPTAPPGLDGYSPEYQKILIANGTYNADGSVNMETARRLGWTKIWEEQNRPATTMRAEPPKP